MHFGKRGQSALEYLMTYGWALVVIVIAVAALVILINPSNIQGDTCDSKLGQFVITQSDINASAMKLVLVNQTGQGVSAMSFLASGTGATTFTDTNLSESSVTMNAGETKTFTLSGLTLNSGTYNITTNLTYTAGSLSGLTASAQCRGTI